MNSPKVYKHNPDFKPDAPFLSDAAMREVLDARPILCVDILFIDTVNKTLLLPKRTRQPAEGLWFIGGMIKRSTPPDVAALKVIEREAKTAADSSRLHYLNASWFEWDYRGTEPSKNGRVDFNLCYTYEPTPGEQAAIASELDPNEYDTNHGLKSYSREDLVTAIAGESACKQVLVDYYDQIFNEP